MTVLEIKALCYILLIFAITWGSQFLVLLYDKSGLERKMWLRQVEPGTIYLYMDINMEYFKDTIDEWCVMHHKYIEDGKIIDMRDGGF